MKEWLSIKEASAMTGKHSDTIRHFIKKNPEAIMKDEKGKIFIKAETLKEKFLLKEIQVEDVQSQEANQKEQLLQALLAELEQKNAEINRLQNVVEKMTEQQVKLIDQQQRLSAGLLLNAENPTNAQRTPTKKKHWWSK